MAYRDRHHLDKPAPSVVSNPATEDRQARPEAKQPEQSTRLSSSLESATARIVDLESQGRALRQRVHSLELQLDATQRRLGSVESVLRQLRATAHQADGAQTAKAMANTSPLTLTHPWMVPSSHDPLGYVPKWPLLERQELAKIEREAEQTLRLLQSALVFKEIPDLAVQLRQCEQRPDRLLQKVNRAVAQRIACVEKSERTTDEQIRNMLDQLLADIECPHPSEGIMDMATWTEFLIQYRQAIKMIAFMHINQIPSPSWAIDLPA